MSFAATMAVAFAIDACLGWPAWLHARIGHPVVWIGALVSVLDRRLNRGPRFVGGVVTVLLVLAVVVAPAWLIAAALPSGLAGILLGGVLAWPFLAVRSMHEHVAAVVDPLMRGDLAGARATVAMIVGRDPAQLDAAGVGRAALESLAENTSDGIVAPLFWGAVAGVPGIAAYKAINTMDSMIGHHSDRYEAFGKPAARLDDLVNLVPARLTALLFALASGRLRHALGVIRRDAGLHRSPNAGWPEAAMAAALEVRLSGPRVYGDRIADERWVNGDAPDPAPDAVTRGLALYRRTMLLSAAILFVLAFI